jgi:hypothetical protein
MEYVICVILIIFILWVYHRFKYRKSGYQKFEYYLDGEVNDIVKYSVLMFEAVSAVSLLGFVIYFGGNFIRSLF